LGIGGAAPAWSHGATAAVETLTTVRITSQYDTGEPISQGQVAVYRPDQAETPWLTGTTDADGVFEFTPDETAGNWEVVIRKAGHGQSLTVALGDDSTSAASPTLSATQKGLTGLAVVWGLVGTALFLARRSPPDTGVASPAFPPTPTHPEN